MNFCVLVKISKHKVSFWYQSGSSPYAALIIRGSHEVPLYFYVNGTEFIFGEDIAMNRFNSNDSNAYGNYFEIIKDPGRHFTIAGNTKPVKQLLYYGIEKYLNFFITQVLYKNDSLESYRQGFPLRFWFESDIEGKEKSLIENLFNEAGYDNVERVDYNENLFQVLASLNITNANKAVLMLNGINNTLYIELYKNILAPITENSKLEGHGADPSVKLLAEMILEDILAQESYLNVNKEVEIAHLLPYSAARLENISPIIKGDAVLTDGKNHYFEIRHRVLNERLLFYSSDNVVYAAIDEILSSNSVNIQNLTVLMGTKEINTPYMINKLLSKYPIVKGVEQKNSNDALKSIFAKIAQSGYQVKKISDLQNSNLPPEENKINILSGSTTSSKALPPLTIPLKPPVISTPPIIIAPPIINTPPLPPRREVIQAPIGQEIAAKTKTPEINKPEVKKPPIPPAPPVSAQNPKVPPPPITASVPKAKVPPPPPPPPSKKK